MNYSLNHKIDEANIMYRVCEGIRKRLLALVESGADKLECAGKLADFYAVVAPRQEQLLMSYPDEAVIAHLLASVGTHIYIHLGPEEYVDFFKLRDFLKAEWPEVYQEIFVEKKTSFFAISGKELTIDPSSGLLLEKSGIIPPPHFGVANVEGSTVKRTATGKHEEPRHPHSPKASQMADDMLKTEFGAPISFEQIQKAGEALEKMDEATKHALYRYWSAITARDIPIELVWTHFGTFAMWAVENGYELGYRLQRDVLEEGYVIGNVKWAPVKPGIPMTDRAGNRVFDDKKDGQE